MAHSKFRQLILVLLLTPALVFAAWCSWQVYDISTQRANIKDDFSEGNSIYYGLLSVNNWREEIKNIVRNRIDEFELNNKQDSLLRIEISSLLHTMIYKAESQIEQDDDGVRKTLRKWVVNAAVNWDNLHQQVPGFTETILEELTSEASKERLKEIALSKVEDLAAKLHDDSVDIYLNRLYGKYNTQSLPAFNETIKTKAKAMDEETYRYTYWTVSVVLLFLLMWFLTKKYPELRKPLMLMSVLLAIVVLLGGLASPMIEIDARIRKIDFTFLGSHIVFDDQVLFYRSKSILQVVSLLLQSARVDSKLVGFLVLAFSVILPVSKLLSTLVYMYANARWRANSLLQWFAFKSGKWSMADVIIVAIFMAYVGFDGILDDQLKQVERNNQMLTSIATNLTSLEAGFILFLSFVLFSLILSEILKRSVKKSLKTKD